MTETNIDVRGQTCPVPLVECRKAIRKASPGDEIIIQGTHPASKKEIPMACEAMGIEVVEVDETDDKEWKIRIKR
ncbi:sulfurtransferase TusA family protein [Methanolobus bombayensis]|uniref:sulfurtransferase TusA family protein n=1 Tax=Methanolobus bombayensis TaxID=38023 RepID=UPI001AE482A5|nr:sulfurtransferase TusA family protein [Methanolobus bombayensis]MBP1908523.1 TusA-related sulfurtransferase [Methanolobus bombayensis]